MRELKTLKEFREAWNSDDAIVITDVATGNRFHPHPQTCGHVREEYFEMKVIQNAGKNGRYFSVKDLLEAQARWPGVADCWT